MAAKEFASIKLVFKRIDVLSGACYKLSSAMDHPLPITNGVPKWEM